MKLLILCFLTINASFVTQSIASDALYADYVTMQLEYSDPDDLEKILDDVKKFAKSCSQLDEFAVHGNNRIYIIKNIFTFDLIITFLVCLDSQNRI